MNTTTTAAAEITDPSTPVFIQCYRCGGSGRILAFSTIHAGLCYACNGSGGRRSTVGHEAKLAKRRDQAAVRRQAKRGWVMGTVTRSHSMFRVPEVISVRADEIIPGDLIVLRRPRIADRVFRVEDLTTIPGGVRLVLTDFHSTSGRAHNYPVKADAPALIATREGAG